MASSSSICQCGYFPVPPVHVPSTASSLSKNITIATVSIRSITLLLSPVLRRTLPPTIVFQVHHFSFVLRHRTRSIPLFLCLQPPTLFHKTQLPGRFPKVVCRCQTRTKYQITVCKIISGVSLSPSPSMAAATQPHSSTATQRHSDTAKQPNSHTAMHPCSIAATTTQAQPQLQSRHGMVMAAATAAG
jgi:hypothetical protein